MDDVQVAQVVDDDSLRMVNRFAAYGRCCDYRVFDLRGFHWFSRLTMLSTRNGRPTPYRLPH